MTGAVLYLPLAAWLVALALHDGLLRPSHMATALGLALGGHLAEVGHTVFKRW